MEINSSLVLGQRIRSFLEQGQNTFGLDINEYAERLLECRPEQLIRWKQRPQDLPVDVLFHLCQKMNISIDCVFEGTVDYNVLFEQFYGNLKALPERYTIGANSKARTIKIITDFCKSSMGDNFQRQLFRYFQISEKFIENDDNRVNLNLVRDILAYLRKYKQNESLYFSIGLSSVTAFRQSPAGPVLSKQRNIWGVYQNMFDGLIHHIELNCDYKIRKLNSGMIVLNVSPKKETQDALGTRRAGSWEICHYKLGIISSLPIHISRPPSHVVKTKCIHRGDAQCTFEIS